ncbi:recombinase family protein [Mycobacterium ostraviense]|uniref:Recombinase domain-containing protein n=1 Tax=Mycobacterium ostraviense TaxID=2738409 RepID=A0A162FQI8_9MYCO|nr:recombinase family protein [Mycobacterium ostraviense]KZS67176.1 hypothetical protein A4G28_20910 [Mycobacterium ostraviense]UGT90124.1 recombinase family protein [Mycobacterium ostraviense]
MARAEVERKSARHKRALQQHAQAGKIPHGPRLFGYTATGHVDPKESVIVADIFERFYASESLRSVKQMLTETVPSRNGRPWNTRTVRDMLTNPRYAGWAVYQGEIATDTDGNLVRGQWSPLIGEDTFDVFQARLSDPSRKSSRVGHRSPLHWLGAVFVRQLRRSGPDGQRRQVLLRWPSHPRAPPRRCVRARPDR